MRKFFEKVLHSDVNASIIKAVKEGGAIPYKKRGNIMSSNISFLNLVSSYPSSAEIREVNLYLDSPDKIRSFFSSIKFDFDRLLSDILYCELNDHTPFWKTSSHSNICTICISHRIDDLYFCGDLCFEFNYEEDSDEPTGVNLISFDADFSSRC